MAGLTLGADSHMARDSFKTFIPLSVDNDSRSRIIFDFFDLLAAIAAHSKTGLEAASCPAWLPGGRLSIMTTAMGSRAATSRGSGKLSLGMLHGLPWFC
jgi:hypothetical protein